MKNIAVIGGGASGLIAACFAAGDDKKVTIFEKQKKLGRKIQITGNGRCNISNRNIDFSKYHGENPRFVNNIFSRFGLEETENFFLSIGIPFIEEKKGRLFPASLQASTVTRLLEYELIKKEIDIKLHRRVDTIKPLKNRFKVLTAGKEEHTFDSIILSTGNYAYPQLGGTKFGLEMAKSLGHRVHEPFPSILPINIPLKEVHRLQGIKWECAVSVIYEGKVIAATTGELLFTGYGLSGTAALDVSRAVNEKVKDGRTPEIIIDFFPEFTADELMNRLKLLWLQGEKKVSFSLIGILKERMPEVLLKISGIDPDKKVSSLSYRDKESIIRSLKGFKLVPGKARSFNEAVVASGGVDVDEVNPKTMESRIIKNLYLTGELLDIDGDSGGYNLQFAWSTGAIAGMSQ